MGVRDDDEGLGRHGAKDGPPLRGCKRRKPDVSDPPERLTVRVHDPAPAVSETMVRVNYSETDQMGVVYHARYLVWLDMARMRAPAAGGHDLPRAGGARAPPRGERGSVRYRQPARYDDLIRVRCWVRELASRRVNFGYAVEHADDGAPAGHRFTSLLALDSDHVAQPDTRTVRARPAPDRRPDQNWMMRVANWILVLCVGLSLPAGARAQEEAVVEQLAPVLAAEDARQWEPELFQRGAAGAGLARSARCGTGRRQNRGPPRHTAPAAGSGSSLTPRFASRPRSGSGCCATPPRSSRSSNA